MSRLSKTLLYIESRPITVIEVILGIVLLVFAVYLGGPWYIAGPSTVIGNSIESSVVRAFTAIVYFIPSSAVVFGMNHDRIRTYGMFGLSLAYLFTTILRILTIGLTPLMWIFTLGMALICGIIYVSEARKRLDS